jgi:pantoate--beta-alanine ligase
MKLITDPLQFQATCEVMRAGGHRLGLVPTMGALHEGHLALLDEAKSRTDRVVVTIFLNPTQFGPNEDLDRYPRVLERDLELCATHGAAVVFAPEAGGMYLPGDATRVSVGGLDRVLCGASRPNHFAGVCTVVTKLFQLTGRCTAVFGRKDYQQWKIIERMTADLFMPIALCSIPIVREPDGLALSSRNARLGPHEGECALGLVRGLSRAQRAFDAGQRSAAQLRDLVLREVKNAGLLVDYVAVADADALTGVATEVAGRALLAAAVYAGDVRLIDNVVLGEDPPLGELS